MMPKVREIVAIIKLIIYHFFTRKMITSKYSYLFLKNYKNNINKEKIKIYNFKFNEKNITSEIHCLCGPTIDKVFIDNHKKVFEVLNIPINYTITQQKSHGEWIEKIVSNSNSSVVLFLDCDCIPLNKNIIDYSISKSFEDQALFGIAQVSNHIKPYSFIFAGPAFLALPVDLWHKLGRPPLKPYPGFDVCEYLSYLTCMFKEKMHLLMPLYFHGPSVSKLHSISNYGSGTYYEGGVFHLWESRNKIDVNYFIDACEMVINKKEIDFYKLYLSRSYPWNKTSFNLDI